MSKVVLIEAAAVAKGLLAEAKIPAKSVAVLALNDKDALARILVKPVSLLSIVNGCAISPLTRVLVPECATLPALLLSAFHTLAIRGRGQDVAILHLPKQAPGSGTQAQPS
jgi:hypothetical protein